MELIRNMLSAIAPEVVDSLQRVTDDSAWRIYTVSTAPPGVMPLWEKLYQSRMMTGFYPVILGPHYQAREMVCQPGRQSPQELLRAAELLDPGALLAGRESEVLADLEDEMPDFYEIPPRSPAKDHQFHTIQGLRGRADSLSVALVPTVHSYEVPAWLPFGGWNECPQNAEHVSVLRLWHSHYGADLTCMDSDILELWVEKPVTQPEEALELAKQQFAYCEDIVTQGTESVGALAGELLDSHHWFFWWD